MAIKPISQLDKFDNETPTNGNNSNNGFAIGGKMAWLSPDLLTEGDKEVRPAQSYPNSFEYFDKFSDGYYNSLFEISQPENNLQANNPNAAFFSRKTPYQDLIKNIIQDVKAFLNYRNQLNDYDLCAVIDGNYIFHGNKELIGNLSVSNSIFSENGTISNLTSDNITIRKNLFIDDVSINNIHVNSLTVIDTMTLQDVDEITTKNNSTFFKGYAFGLKDNKDTLTNVGSLNSVGDAAYPVRFVDGRPVQVNCVESAKYAKYLVDSNGSALCCGDGTIINEPYSPKYSSVYIKDGVFYATNVIDYSLHSFWSDLGEKYLADIEYEPGTLVKFGGEKEITIADTEVNAIVSTKAFDLNACLAGGITIALCGRVPTKVKGSIKKFDKIMLSDMPGIACKWDGKSRVIGRALESNDDENIKLVECVTKFEI